MSSNLKRRLPVQSKPVWSKMFFLPDFPIFVALVLLYHRVRPCPVVVQANPAQLRKNPLHRHENEDQEIFEEK